MRVMKKRFHLVLVVIRMSIIVIDIFAVVSEDGVI